MKPYSGEGSLKEDYYAYSKPVLATSDGFIEEIYDGIEDNSIGEDNLQNNWGNSIIIKHSEYLYSKISHLQKNSFTVKKGDFVKRGELVAKCGNSGRSPYPHIHFQFQSSPKLDSPSIEYELSFFEKISNSSVLLLRNSIPNEGEIVRNPEESNELKKAFKFAPDSQLKFTIYEKGKTRSETWKSMVDQYNRRYLYCEESKSFAYFVSYDSSFRFYNFYGDNTSLLYLFRLAVPQLLLLDIDKLSTKETLPMSVAEMDVIRIFQDFISPFHIFLKPFAQIKLNIEKNDFDSSKIKILSSIFISIGKFKREKFRAAIDVVDGSITKIEITSNNRQIKALCED